MVGFISSLVDAAHSRQTAMLTALAEHLADPGTLAHGQVGTPVYCWSRVCRVDRSHYWVSLQTDRMDGSSNFRSLWKNRVFKLGMIRFFCNRLNSGNCGLPCWSLKRLLKPLGRTIDPSMFGSKLMAALSRHPSPLRLQPSSGHYLLRKFGFALSEHAAFSILHRSQPWRITVPSWPVKEEILLKPQYQ
jgi:hypothetical protein